LPLGDRSFFVPGAPTIDENQVLKEDERVHFKAVKQPSYPPRRNVVGGILRRKQVSLDLMSPQQATFFSAVVEAQEEEEVDEEVHEEIKKMFFPLRFSRRLGGGRGHGRSAEGEEDEEVAEKVEIEAPPIVSATRRDKIQAIILACIMIALVGVCVGWETHEDESHSIFGLSGVACVTDCLGNSETRNFFVGHEDHFHKDDVIGLKMHLDPVKSEEDVFKKARVEITRIDKSASGASTQVVVKTVDFGPPDEHHRETFDEKVVVDWDYPDHYHVINIFSETGDVLSFTLAATRQSPLSRHSVIIAACIMILVYIFILLEVIHRTLVAIFGSMLALFFFFLMHNGETESIRVSRYYQGFTLQISTGI